MKFYIHSLWSHLNVCMCPEAQAGSDLYYTVKDHVYIYTT